MHDRARSSFLVPFLLSCFPTGVVKTCFWSCEFSNTVCGTQSIWALGICILCSGRQMFRIDEATVPFGGLSSKAVIFVVVIIGTIFFFQKCLKISSFVWMQMGTWIVIKAFWELHLPFMVVWTWPTSILGDFNSLPHWDMSHRLIF